MAIARWGVLALILAAPAISAGFAGKNELPRAAGPAADAALCAGLDQSVAALRAAFAKSSAFPDQVRIAFVVRGTDGASAENYLTRGRELARQADAASAQCRAAFGAGVPQTSPAGAAVVRRNAQRAKRWADLYMDLPRTIGGIDSAQNPAGLAQRPQFLTAMFKIADGGDFDSAGAIADAAHDALSRLRR